MIEEVCGCCRQFIFDVSDAAIANADRFGITWWHKDCVEKVQYEQWKKKHGIDGEGDK